MNEEGANNRKKILVFEDDLAFRSSYVSALESRGFEVLVFTSPQEVTVEQIKRLTPDLISYDIFMPGMTGIAAAEAYARDKELSSVPFIFVSSQDGDMQEKALRLKPKKFFHKFSSPISEIVQYIDHLLH
ncbi:MAG: response regulator [Patescibacteria group bacterium]|jgi:CheY-like chemotaxis protein